MRSGISRRHLCDYIIALYSVISSSFECLRKFFSSHFSISFSKHTKRIFLLPFHFLSRTLSFFSLDFLFQIKMELFFSLSIYQLWKITRKNIQLCTMETFTQKKTFFFFVLVSTNFPPIFHTKKISLDSLFFLCCWKDFFQFNFNFNFFVIGINLKEKRERKSTLWTIYRGEQVKVGWNFPLLRS